MCSRKKKKVRRDGAASSEMKQCAPRCTQKVSQPATRHSSLSRWRTVGRRQMSDEWMSRVLLFAPLLSAAADAERESPYHLLVSGPSTNFVAPCLGTVKVAYISGSHIWHIDHQGLFLLALFVFSSDRTLNTVESGPRRVRFRSPHAQSPLITAHTLAAYSCSFPHSVPAGNFANFSSDC